LLDAELVMPELAAAFARGSASPWAELKALADDTGVIEAIGRLNAWDFSTPTGIIEGYDPGDVPFALTAPTPTEMDHSVAATLFSVWRGQAIRAVIDTTMTRIGLGAALPGGDESYIAFKYL
ncbi:MAG: penicillin acylase family protein, partial [Lysobacterales bacterium CG_4_9_14_3_um_filter_62_6]